MSEKNKTPGIQSQASILQTIQDVMHCGGCDLHMHTNHSDGSNTTQQLVDRVIQAGLCAFAIADHDTTAAIEEARQYLDSLPLAQSKKPLFIPAVELSVDVAGYERHLLGYFDPKLKNPLSGFLKTQRAFRQDRNRRMIKKLRELGYDITFDALKEISNESTGRVQTAILLQKKGYVQNIQEAFDLLLGEGKPAYVSRERPDIETVIQAIHQAGGAAVLAHPAHYGWCSGHKIVSQTLVNALSALKAKGLDGVEAYHGETKPADQMEIEAAGSALQLILTAGSDDHGLNKNRLLLYQRTDHWPNRKIMLVVGALDTRKNANGQFEYLLFQRKLNGRHAGLWELPGGKVEKGEPPEDALARELLEELDQNVKIGSLHTVLYHDYPDERVILLIYNVSFNEKALKLLVHDQKIRATRDQALKRPLLPADQTLFQSLA